MKTTDPKKKRSKRRDLIEIGAILGIFAILYFTGLHTDVAGFMQRALLKTGIHNPSGLAETQVFGQASYALNLQDMAGNAVSMEEMKGKVVFVNFWATWCPPCIAEMPDIDALYRDMGSEQIAFLMISMDKSAEQASKFIERKGYALPVFMPMSRIPTEFESSGIPATFVLAPDGQIVYQHVGIANYNTKAFRDFLEKLATPAG